MPASLPYGDYVSVVQRAGNGLLTCAHEAGLPAQVADEGTDPQATVRGTAAGLYLALWNRGDDIEVSGDHSLVARWRTTQRIRWS